ncbi:MAG: RluA family pseudouridine synthase [Flavobacteriales bacterium]|nr:RluA family pseudouridine synthase [Flavobacteriales bacterium]
MKEDLEDSFSEDDDIELQELTFVADKGQEPLRIDKFLIDRVSNTSRNRIQNAAKSNCIIVNGSIVKSNYKVRPGDQILVYMTKPEQETSLRPEDIPLDIVFEDEQVLVINKPAGLVCHPGYGNKSGTLVNALLYHLENLPTRDQEDRPGIVHRLDKMTTGIMVVAKTELAMTHLARQFFNRTSQRFYYALIWGEPPVEEGIIEGHIGRSLKDRKIMTVFDDESFGKPAVTRYKIIEKFGYVTLVQCKLETGRTHQIRAHFKSIGHPLFGDITYGGDRILKGTTFAKYKQFVENCFKLLPRQALHAKTLGFEHPTTGKFLHFNSDLPSDMEMVLDKWRNYAVHQQMD